MGLGAPLQVLGEAGVRVMTWQGEEGDGDRGRCGVWVSRG